MVHQGVTRCGDLVSCFRERELISTMRCYYCLLPGFGIDKIPRTFYLLYRCSRRKVVIKRCFSYNGLNATIIKVSHGHLNERFQIHESKKKKV